MSINHCSFVSWGLYGGTSQLSKASQAHLAASWGLFVSGVAATFNWLKSWYWWNNPYTQENG
ncbi:MAG: hypothetical protein ACLQVJ_19205 [Syntrophobacteraceae bacterium]